METAIKPLQNKPRFSALLVLSWAGILLPLAIYSYFIYSFSLNIPFADDFTIMIQAINIMESEILSDKLSILFSQDGEHRVVLNRLAFILSYALLGEISFKFLPIFGNIALVATLYLFFKILKVPHTNLFYFVPIPILLFQLQSWDNMTWSVPALQKHYILFFSLLTFYFLSKNSTKGFYGGFFFATISVFTNGSGLVTIFLGWVILLIRKKYRENLIWASGACLLALFYFKNFHPHTNVLAGTQSIAGFKNMMMYFFAYLGSSISFNNLYAAVGIGLIFSFYLCFLIWEKYFLKNMTAFIFIVYIFLTAGLVSMARSDLGIDNVFASRYKIDSVILMILVYVSLIERFSLNAIRLRNFATFGILFATFSYILTFKSGAANLETRNKSLTWLTNQWVNTNHGFFYTPGMPGANDKTPNSILLKAVDNGFYKLPYQILHIPDKGYSPAVLLPKTCGPKQPKAFQAKFSTIPIGPKSNPFTVRLEGMIHSPTSDGPDDIATIHIVLKSKNNTYIFKTRPQPYLEGSVFFKRTSSNAGFIALLPFEKIKNGFYRIGFCYKGTTHFENKLFIKNNEGFKLSSHS